MKNIYCFIALGIYAFILRPGPAPAAHDPRAFLREESEVYLQAFLEKDYDTCLKMMGGEIVRALGGKISVLNHYHATEDALKLHKLKLETITVGEPGRVIDAGAKEQYVVIPEKHCYRGKDGQYILDSYMLAVSEDSGRSWNMLEGSWRLSEHIKNKDLLLYDRLKLPVRKIYFADDPRLVMLEKGGGFVTPPETIKYKQSLRQRNNPPPSQPVRIGR
jgi:hypothetical protein